MTALLLLKTPSHRSSETGKWLDKIPGVEPALGSKMHYSCVPPGTGHQARGPISLVASFANLGFNSAAGSWPAYPPKAKEPYVPDQRTGPEILLMFILTRPIASIIFTNVK